VKTVLSITGLSGNLGKLTKVKLTLEEAIKAQRRSRGIALLFLNLGARWGGSSIPASTNKDVLHLPVEYTGQSNSWIDRKTFKHWYFHTFISVSERTFPQD
jgi:hypothetical protein